MIDNPLSPEEQAIIQQIQAVPRLEISLTARTSIRERMLSEFRMVGPQNAAHATTQTRRLALAATAIVIITIVVIIVLAIIANQSATQSTATTVTSSASPQATNTPMLSTTVPTGVTETVVPKTKTPESSSLTPAADTTQEAVLLPAETSTTAPASTLPPTTTQQAIRPSPTTTSTQDTLVVIEGPVTNIVNNIITIYDFEIEIDPEHPMLNLIGIGDVLHIEGMHSSAGSVVATVVSNLSDMQLVDGATVSLEGPVELINGNIIVVNSISVQLAANDPLLQTVQVGQFVSVQGNFQKNGDVFVLVVVNIVVVNVNTGGNNTGGNNGDNSNCVWKENGMSGMGKWKCSKGMGK